ncbi:hypothetical protein BVC80_5g24 [Macleaya cordata]|uniref:Uncharacterized protein n=1 Tax=Macleaya cordata TaxID=56857 RepID=A0A200QXP1_MACCD|nr:hypothetical protein BVC80_5g24 [Macleaya cordata]
MEKSSSHNNNNEADETGSFSCLGCLKLKLPWSKNRNSTTSINRQRSVGSNLESVLMFKTKQRKPKGGFRYDPLSYSQNFDNGSNWDEDGEDYSHRGFSSRFVSSTASTKRLEDQ